MPEGRRRAASASRGAMFDEDLRGSRACLAFDPLQPAARPHLVRAAVRRGTEPCVFFDALIAATALVAPCRRVDVRATNGFAAGPHPHKSNPVMHSGGDNVTGMSGSVGMHTDTSFGCSNRRPAPPEFKLHVLPSIAVT